MGQAGNIVICDWSAYHLYMHSEGPHSIGAVETEAAALNDASIGPPDFKNFNASHPLYGGKPVNLLVSNPANRRVSADYVCACCAPNPPKGSLLKLRNGLYITSPEFTYARLASQVSEMRLSELGTNLCGNYFISMKDGKLHDRPDFITTPEKLQSYLNQPGAVRGSVKARKALHHILGNSASPFESKTLLQFCAPLRKGSFNLPFTVMNLELNDVCGMDLSKQDSFSLDLVAPEFNVCIEYDGEESHQDASKDKVRRNVLAALGWQVFPLDKEVLYSPMATERFANQVAKYMGIRIRKPKCWDEKFIELRHDLDLPV